jgi:hypothetical protein
MIFLLAESIKELSAIENESIEDRFSIMRIKSVTQSNPITNGKVIVTIVQTVQSFYELLMSFIENNKAEFTDFKLVSQLYVEFELFNRYLSDLVVENSKQKQVSNYLFKILSKLKQTNKNTEFLDESVVFTGEELNRKKRLVEDYLNKYFSYLRCFKIN